MLEILRQVLREPTLPEGEFEVMKNEQIAGLEQGRIRPDAPGPQPASSACSRSIPATTSATCRPSTRRSSASRQSPSSRSATLYRDYLGADHGELAIVGDFEPSEVLPILRQDLRGLEGRQALRADRAAVPARPEARRKETIETPDKANATYIAGLEPADEGRHPDYPALVAGNFILGGGALSSRIADRLRQKGGSPTPRCRSSRPSPLDAQANLLILAIYNPTNVDKVVAGVDEELAKILRDGVTAATSWTAPRTGYLQQQEVMRTNDTMLAVVLAENLYIGRTMQFQADLEAEDQGPHPRGGQRRHPQVHRSQAALRRHGGGFQGEVGSRCSRLARQ